jgi:glycerol-1-phosphatase
MTHADRYEGFALDLDGVVWLAGRPIDGSVEAITALRELGKPTVFITNDPRSTRDEYARRLAEIGVGASPDDMITSGAAVAEAILAETPAARVLVAGSDGLRDDLAAAGLTIVAGDEADSDAVVVGGHADFDYAELRSATDAVRAGAALWATNRDATYPTPGGLQPGTGAIVAAVETATGQRARAAGKPEPAMFETARHALDVARPAIVGDSLDSDIAGGARAGFGTVLVLTGRADRAAVERAEVAPDLVLTDLAALVE